MEEKEKRYLTIEGLEYFLEKFKYCMAHNDKTDKENQNENKYPN